LSEFPLILKAVQVLQWLAEKLLIRSEKKSEKREKRRDSLGELLRNVHQYVRGHLARIVYRDHTFPPDVVKDKEKDLLEAQYFLIENKHRYTPEIKALIESLLRFAMSKNYDSMKTTFSQLKATIESEQANS